MSSRALPSAWMLVAGDEVFDLEAELRQVGIGGRFNWGVSRSSKRIHLGDPVVFWQRGQKDGIHALGEIVEEPYGRDEMIWTDGTKGPRTNDKWRVVVQVTRILRRPIPASELRRHSLLRNLRVLGAYKGSSDYQVDPEDWVVLHRMIEECSL